MPFQDLDFPVSHLHCTLVAYSPACATLAEALVSCWANSSPPATLALDGATIPESLLSPAALGYVLMITAEVTDAAVLNFNRLLVARNARTLTVLTRPSGLWTLWRGTPSVSPCVACLSRQSELMPRNAGTSSFSVLDRARSLSHWIAVQLPMKQDEEYCTLHPVLAGLNARPRQILQDPLCPCCSMHAVRPNHVIFTSDS